MLYTKEQINDIKSRVNIEDVIGRFVVLKKSGSSFRGLSPFSNEKTPSFFVRPSEGFYKDFSSGKAGDVFSFLMEHERLSFEEAIEYVAEVAGVEVKKQQVYSSQEQDARNSALSINHAANGIFKSFLVDEAPTYFIERGFTKECLEYFEIGYCPHDLAQRMGAIGYNNQRMVEASILKKNERGVYAFFYNRITFPIKDVTGNIIGFGARSLRDAKPKYLNTSDTVLYSKSKVLYGIYESKEHIRKQNKCYAVEGYTDVMAMHQDGIKNVVATSGTAFTVFHAKEIKRLCENVVVVYDGDKAGQNATIQGIKSLLKAGLNVSCSILEDGKDPCDYVMSNRGKAITEREVDFIKYLVSSRLKANATVSEKTTLIHLAIDLIGCINDEVKRAVYSSEMSTLLSVPQDVLLGDMAPIVKVESSLEYKPDFGNKIESEVLLVSCIMKYDKLHLDIGGGCSVLEYILHECQDACGEMSKELNKIKDIVMEGRFPTEQEYFDILHRNLSSDVDIRPEELDAVSLLKNVTGVIYEYKRFLLSVILQKNLKMIDAYSDSRHLIDNAYLNKIKKLLYV